MYSAGITASGNRNTCFRECHMNHKMNGQAGFTLIELIVVIVILGILAVTAAPKFMNLTSDANASVVKGLAGSVKSAYQMVYAKSRLNTSVGAVCASEDCSGASTGLYNENQSPLAYGVIYVTDKGYPVSSTTEYTLAGKTWRPSRLASTIAGAVDLGIGWEDFDKLGNTDGTNPADWIVYTNTNGIAFVPKSAPTSAKDKALYTTSDNDKACGVYYEAKQGVNGAPTVKVFVKGC